MELTEIPKTLKNLRNNKGLNYMGVARISGLSPKTVTNAEAGKGITLGTLDALLTAFGYRLVCRLVKGGE